MIVNFSEDIDTVLETAVTAARRAGDILREGWSHPKHIRFKGEINLVTEYDLKSEQIIVDVISSRFPGHDIIAEEGGEHDRHSNFRWYIDPLDGTTNFAHGFPVFCTSIAFAEKRPEGPLIQAGVVYDPLRDEMFTAVRGGGSFLNGKPLSVSREDDLNRALVATGFPYDVRENPDGMLARFKNMIMSAQGIRRAGAAAIDLAWVAAGRIDGYWESGLWPWDTAAGMLLVEEAGGKVTDYGGGLYNPHLKEILATNGRVHYTMVKVLDV